MTVNGRNGRDRRLFARGAHRHAPPHRDQPLGPSLPASVPGAVVEPLAELATLLDRWQRLERSVGGSRQDTRQRIAQTARLVMIADQLHDSPDAPIDTVLLAIAAQAIQAIADRRESQ